MKHIAIMRQPFLDMVVSGEKTIETRWTMHKIAPYNKIEVGDEILFKETGKKVSARAIASKVDFFELTPQLAEKIKDKYGKQIGVDKFSDWNDKAHKNYCTLIWLKNVEKIEPFDVPKSHGAGWIILK